MKPICENLGVDWEGQRQKIKRHPALNRVACMIKATAEDGKMYEMLMLPVKFLNGWLFGIDSNRVKPEIQERLISYQTECFEVLANHFMPKVNETAANGQLSEFLKPITEPITLEDFNWRKQILCEAIENLEQAHVLMMITVSGKELLAGKCFE
jgi:hypothetical protein